MNEGFRKKLMESSSGDEILTLIDNEEKEYLKKEESRKVENKTEKENKESKGFILAVTACPINIAHTYMAADSLKNKAKEMGVTIKVETNGSGVKNRLLEDEIERADAIIVVADKQVEMTRFEGKKIIQVPVVQGIKKPEELITRELKGDASVYHYSENNENTPSKSERTEFYKHLMNGVSNMLPFVVGDGILIAISFMFGIKAFANLPQSLEGIKPVLIYPLLGIFITGAIMLLIIATSVKAINTGLAL